jgi:hypothetical protein
MDLKSLLRITRSELSLATSQALPIAIPTLAVLRAMVSDTECPVTKDDPPAYLIPEISMFLSCSVALAMTLTSAVTS